MNQPSYAVYQPIYPGDEQRAFIPCWRCTAQSDDDATKCSRYAPPIADYNVHCEFDSFSDRCHHPELMTLPEPPK